MKTTIIGIAGGTGSGKSTFTNRLKAYFGDRITVMYHDNYYRPHDDLPFEERQKINYDHPDSLETDLLIEHLKALREGTTRLVPAWLTLDSANLAVTVATLPKREEIDLNIAEHLIVELYSK